MQKKVECFTIVQSGSLADGEAIYRFEAPWYIQRLQDTIIFVNTTMGQNSAGIKEITWSNRSKVVTVSHFTAGITRYPILANPKEFLQFLLPDIVRFSVSQSPTYDYFSKMHQLEENPPLYYN